MADITVTATKVGVIGQCESRIKSYIAAATITAGQAVYVTSAGKINLADANGSGTLQFAGIALDGGAAGQAIDVLWDGEVEGFTLTSQAYDAPIYLSNTAGALADAAGGSSIIVGRVSVRSDGPLTKTLQVWASPVRNFS